MGAQCLLDNSMKSKSQKRRKAIQRTGKTRHERFDLDVKSTDQAELLVAHMMSLKANVGWALLKQILEGNIHTLEQVILSKVSISGQVLSDEGVDGARARREIMIEMLNKPDQLIQEFKKKDSVQVPDYDPFATDVRQFKKPTFGSEMSRTLQP